MSKINYQKGNLNLEWYQKNQKLILAETNNPEDLPSMLNWVNKDGALFYQIDETQNRGLKPIWVDQKDYRVHEARPLEFVKRYEAQGDYMQGYTITESNEPKPSDNILIRGDNLLALNTLVSRMEGLSDTEKVKCIYIDPPYNTGSAFDKYDDNLEHSQWLTMMRDRLILMRKLLREDGVIFISCDDDEQAYLKVVCDEIFGRQNFISTFIRKTRNGGGAMSKYIAINHDVILMYAKNISVLPNIYTPYDKSYLQRYKETDNEGRFFWDTFIRRRAGNNNDYTIVAPDGSELQDKWNLTEDKFLLMKETGSIRFVDNNGSWSVQFKQRMNTQGKKSPSILDFATNDQGTNEIVKIFGERVFDYPKPEKILEYLIQLSTQEGDIVFDAFGGSGTTFAVAHKMKRRYIGIEIGEHADTLIIPRLKKVLSATDGVGLTKNGKWTGGGAFSYYHIGESIFTRDEYGTWHFNDKLDIMDLYRGILRYFDASFVNTTEDQAWAYGKNDQDYFLMCLKDEDEDILDIELRAILEKFDLLDKKPMLLTKFNISVSDEMIEDHLMGVCPVPYGIVGDFDEE